MTWREMRRKYEAWTRKTACSHTHFALADSWFFGDLSKSSLNLISKNRCYLSLEVSFQHPKRHCKLTIDLLDGSIGGQKHRFKALGLRYGLSCNRLSHHRHLIPSPTIQDSSSPAQRS